MFKGLYSLFTRPFASLATFLMSFLNQALLNQQLLLLTHKDLLPAYNFPFLDPCYMNLVLGSAPLENVSEKQILGSCCFNELFQRAIQGVPMHGEA